MSMSSAASSTSNARRVPHALSVAVCGLLSVALVGCESIERKFTRKSKQPQAAPSPIISFQDYTRTMTPLDRYRKHYLMFEYWNNELIQTLRDVPLNPKRLMRASTEALSELETMRGLVTDDLATRLAPILAGRAKVHHQLQSAGFSEAQAAAVARVLEAQSRDIHREFFWRDVQEHLKEP